MAQYVMTVRRVSKTVPPKRQIINRSVREGSAPSCSPDFG